jgi:hypothetical protein
MMKASKTTAIERSTTELYVHNKHTAGIEPATIRIVHCSTIWKFLVIKPII